jgi:phenylpropionate dioxygenase-like ring-hydroxylating dioxygenase large terminal subunit
MVQPFNNPDVVVQSWYVAALSHEVRAGQVLSRELLGRRVAIYRGASGRVFVLEGRCAHLGANLGQGTVAGDELCCRFHHWTYAGDGRCVHIPHTATVPVFARTFAYPTTEKYGAVWIFNGPQPAFPIPFFPNRNEDELCVFRLRPRVLHCHPHVIASNGLDIQHFKTVHRFGFAEDPVIERPDEFRVRLKLKIKLGGNNLFEKVLRLLAGETISATFTTWGGNMAQIDGQAGLISVLALFTHRPLEGGRSASQTFFFIPKHWGGRRFFRINMLMAAAVKLIMGYILVEDRKIFDTIQFQPHLVAADAPLAAFIQQVNQMTVFDPSLARCADESDLPTGLARSAGFAEGS